MKKLLLILCLSILFHGCSSKNGNTLTAGAVAVFDAANVLGNGTIPALGCANTTWNNLQNTSQAGVINCSSGDGLAGTGTAADPYRMIFNGTSTSVITNVISQAATYPDATWVVWVNPTNISSLQSILSIDDHLGSYNRALVIDSSSNWGAYKGTGIFSAATADANTWQHMVVVFSANNITVYKNGTPVSLGVAPTIRNTSHTLSIGKSAGGNFEFFQGAIAWIAVYPRAMTQAEVTSSCQSLMGRFTGVLCN